MADKLKYTTKLHGARVVLIGGTSGIGFGVAEAVLEHGATDIILASSSPDKVAAAVDRLKANYPSLAAKATIRGHACDMSNLATIDANLKSLYEAATNGKKDPINHVVYSAGGPQVTKALAEATATEVANRGTVRLVGQFMAVKDAVLGGYIQRSADSSITMTSGSVSERPEHGHTIGAGYGAGLMGYARSLALDLAPVRVNLVLPGVVDTELWDGLGAQKAPLIQRLSALLPTGRVGRPEDVAEAYLYMMRDGFVTGSTLSTNGGFLLKGPDLF